MSYRTLFLLTLCVSALSIFECCGQAEKNSHHGLHTEIADPRPATRLWWFADTVTNETIVKNLDYLNLKGFGRVECAFIYPYNRKDTLYAARYEWLSPAFIEKVRFAKAYASQIGLGFDLTFGTLWPFGSMDTPRSEAVACLKDATHTDTLRYTWDFPKDGLVIDHLSKKALRNYAKRLSDAFQPVLAEGDKLTLLFVDSWEVQSRYLGTHGFLDEFRKRYQYDLIPYLDSLYIPKSPFNQVLYDYRKLISEYVVENFYKEFSAIAHELGTYTRGQASGAPCDILMAYAALDVPESEALLYEPFYSNIPASAAVLSGKKIVSAETFTCLYGWPRQFFKEEQTADLKLLADAVFANGVNQIFWHGKPLARTEEDRFFATVHIGESSALNDELLEFNRYLKNVSAEMQKGHTYGRVAVYLPSEDAWIKGEKPCEDQFIWSWGYYEMRENKMPEELMPWRPLWVNQDFLEKGVLKNGMLNIGDAGFNALYVDAKYLDMNTLRTLVKLAESGFPIVVKQNPTEPGMNKSAIYATLLSRLFSNKNVKKEWVEFATQIEPVLMGDNLPEYWCRETDEGLTIFFAQPKSKDVKYPMGYGQSLEGKTVVSEIQVNYNGHSSPASLKFEPYQSVLLKVPKSGQLRFENISFIPKTPIVRARPEPENGLEEWEVDCSNEDYKKCH